MKKFIFNLNEYLENNYPKGVAELAVAVARYNTMKDQSWELKNYIYNHVPTKCVSLHEHNDGSITVLALDQGFSNVGTIEPVNA